MDIFSEIRHDENTKRAESFLYWKFGERIHCLNRDISQLNVGTWTDVLIEFFEKVDSDILRELEVVKENSLKIASVRSIDKPFAQGYAVEGGAFMDTSGGPPKRSIDWIDNPSIIPPILVQNLNFKQE